MNTGAFQAALVGLLILTIFNYFNYPKEWRKNRIFNIIVLIFNTAGTLALASVMAEYKMIRFEGFKWTVSRLGTFYYVITIMMGILFGLRLLTAIVYGLIMQAAKKDIPNKSKVILADRRAHSILFLLLSAALAVTGYINIGILHSTRYDVHIDKPSVNDTLRVALIADIHAGAGTWRTTYGDLTDRLLDMNTDILLIAGDAFDETTSLADVEYLSEALEDVTPKYGKYFVYGNHDDYTENWAAQKMREMGVTVLEDEMTVIADDIQLIGRLDPNDNSIDLDDLLQKENVDASKPMIILTHRPQEFKRISQTGCDLIVAGHTHGFNIPQFMAVGLNSDMYYGKKQYGGMTAIVTSGVSAWGFHYKFPAISEAVEIDITFD